MKALVTGANRGLGFETCRRLGSRGWKLIVASRDADEGAQAVRRLRSEGFEAAAALLDLTDSQSIDDLAEGLAAEPAPIDALINNAGVALEGFDQNVARNTLAVNYFGTVHATDALLPLLAESATVVMVSSGLGQLDCVSEKLREELRDPLLNRRELHDLMEGFIQGVALHRHETRGWPSSCYRVSKVGLNAFTRVLARELADSSIRVNAVCPGWVRTDMGGEQAERDVTQGAQGIVWAATLPAEGPSGGFFRDGEPIPW